MKRFITFLLSLSLVCFSSISFAAEDVQNAITPSADKTTSGKTMKSNTKKSKKGVKDKQKEMNDKIRQQQAASNAAKIKHETEKSSINNLR
ncbi:MAG: hypothetical protein EPN25_00360 [Nitrospirae bacterium]|nr:MAG: hypothetical protein EPN25_00360 [Nitrospirota bacterium]